MSRFPAKSTIGEPFIELNEVGSTNIYAMEQVQAGSAGHGAAFYALSQTAGKGQHGKTWIAEPGANITLSVVFNCAHLSITQLFELSLVAATACYDVFSSYAGEETRIKWPNDIYWRNRKAGGILIENIVRGDQWLWSVVGMGININQTSFSEMLKNPVSLKQITGKSFNTALLARELCERLQFRNDQWMTEGAGSLLAQYNQWLYKKNETTTFKKGNIVFPCTVREVLPTGELRVEGALQDIFSFGEVEWVLG